MCCAPHAGSNFSTPAKLRGKKGNTSRLWIMSRPSSTAEKLLFGAHVWGSYVEGAGAEVNS